MSEGDLTTEEIGRIIAEGAADPDARCSLCGKTRAEALESGCECSGNPDCPVFTGTGTCQSCGNPATFEKGETNHVCPE